MDKEEVLKTLRKVPRGWVVQDWKENAVEAAYYPIGETAHQAADIINTLTAERDRLRVALTNARDDFCSANCNSFDPDGHLEECQNMSKALSGGKE